MLTLDDLAHSLSLLLDPSFATFILANLLCSYTPKAALPWQLPQPWPPLLLYTTILYICTAYSLFLLRKLDDWLVDAPGIESSGLNGARAMLGLGEKGRKRQVVWAEEVVLVTGGLGGLGREIVEACVIKGAKVAVVDVRDAEEGEEACREIEARRCSGEGEEQVRQRMRYYCCDVGSEQEILEMKKNVERDLGSPTILINNAGITNSKPLLELTSKDIDRTFRINTLAHFHSIRAFLPTMLKASRGGTIVTVASVLGYLGCAGLSDYTASKAALIALHTSLRAELDLSAQTPPASPISLILATPGHLQTPLFSHIPPPPLSSFLGPQVPPRLLAQNIVQAIESGKREIRIAQPLYARWIVWIEVMPLGVRRVVRWIGGVDWAGWEGMWEKRRRDGGG